MRKKVNRIVALTGISGFSLAAACIASIAWFISTIKISDINGTGTTDAAYFAYGTGTAQDPFGISEIRHLSNLSWLQYKGQFDDRPYYFELANDINVDGGEYVMPPIGTEEHPFIGVFDGQGYTVNNIKITNDYTQFTKKPHNITYTQSEAEVIGFFGVVGNLDGESFSSQTNSLHDFTLENLTVESKTTNTLIGLAAGYINADMSGVKVGTSTIKTNGNAAKTAYTDKLSDYGLVGYTTKTGTVGSLEQRLSQYYNSNSQGTDPGWGGSIVIKDLYNRLGTIRDAHASQNKTVGLSYDDTYDATTGALVSHKLHRHLYNNTYYPMSATKDIYNETTYKNGGSYNPKIGAVQMTFQDHGIYYLSGGHYVTNYYKTLDSHTGYRITDGNGHFLSVDYVLTNSGSDAGAFIDTNFDDATLWNVPSNSGYISTQLRYNGSLVTYYIYLNGDILQLSASNNYRTTFTKSTGDNGKIRYISNNYYLAYDSGYWVVRPLPTEPNPLTINSYMSNGYQISYGGRYIGMASTSTTGVYTAITSTYTYGWTFVATSNVNRPLTLEEAVGQSVYVYTTNPSNTNRKYYMYDSGTSSTNFRMNLATNNRTAFTLHKDGDVYKLSYSTYYFVYDNVENVYSCRSAGVVNNGRYYDAMTIETTSSIISNYQSVVANSYCIAPTSQTTTYGPDGVENTSLRTEGMDFSSDQDVTYIPLNVNDDLEAIGTNTGYIVGGSYHSTAGSYSSGSDYNAANAYGYDSYGNVRIASFYTISTYLTNYNRSTSSFNANSVWTYDSSGLHTINDTTNTYKKYAESKGKVEQTLSAGDNIYGLHFMSAVINKENAVTARYAMINGQEYQNYMMPANAIDFNLKEQGYVNFFAGTYGSTTGETYTTIDSFFSLHQIKRNGSTIDAINEIEQIYSDGVSGHSYIYKLSNGNYTIPYSIDKYNPSKLYVLNTKTPITDTQNGGYEDGVYHQINQSTFTSNYSSYSMVFDMDWLKGHSYGNGNNGYRQAFYFEIPTNPGEYALGTVANKRFGAYLMYLDIAANAANKDHITAYAITTLQSGVAYPFGIDFNTSDVSTDEGGATFAIVITAGQTSDGDINFDVDGTSVYYDADFATNYAYSEKVVSGTDPPGPAVQPPASGVRNIYVHILTTDYLEWDIVVTETLDTNGDATSSTISSVRCGGESVSVNDIPESFVLNSIKPVIATNIAYFTRLTGTGVFNMTPVYSGTDFKTVDISIELNGTTLEVSNIATGYSIIINDVPMSNNSVYPAS